MSARGAVFDRLDPASLLVLSACVGVTALPWVLPTEIHGMATGFQSAAGGLGVLLLVAVVWLVPRVVNLRALSVPEWGLVLYVLLGTLVTLSEPAPIGRLAVPIWWMQALLVVLTLARIRDRALLEGCVRACALFATGAAILLIGYRLAGADGRMPFMVHQNHFALLLILPIAFHCDRLARPPGLHRVWEGVALLVLLYALLLTQSRAVWLGVLAAVTTVTVTACMRALGRGSRRRLLWPLLVPVTLVACLVAADWLSVRLGLVDQTAFGVVETFQHLDEGSIGGRIRRWTNALALIHDHWLVGVGLGNWPVAFESYRHALVADSGGNPSALNSYLQVLAETGVFGFALFMLFVVSALLNGSLRRVPTAILAAGIGWCAAIAFHSMQDYKIMLLGFAMVFGMLSWRAREPSNAAPPVEGSSATRALVVAAMVLLTAADARYSLAAVERDAVREVAWSGDSQGADRLLWKVLDPLSRVIDVPFDRQSIVGNDDGLAAANRFQPPDHLDFFMVLGNLAYDDGDAQAALAWYQRALSRNPLNNTALANSCVAAWSMGAFDAAREHCRRGVRANPFEPRFHRWLAALDNADGDAAGAVERLETARGLLRERLGRNDFGLTSRGIVSDYYARYRAISDELTGLRQKTGVVQEQALREIAQTPLLHKSIAVQGCDLYFSTNVNARYNLWHGNHCARDPTLELVTNDSRAPFRLRAAGGSVYFMADTRGDNRFALFRLDTARDDVRAVPLPAGKLLEYSPSPDGSRLAVVVYERGAFRLFAGDPVNGSYSPLHQSRKPLSEPVWYSSTAARDWLLVTDGTGILRRIDLRDGAHAVLVESPDAHLEKPSVSPDGSLIAYASRSGAMRSALHLLQADGGGARTLLASDSSVLTDPTWRDNGTIVFREVINDEYLLRQFKLRDPNLTPLGPPSGVVYDVLPGKEPGSLIVVAATPEVPASLYRIAAGSTQAEPMLRLDWISPAMVAPYRRVVIDPGLNVVVYRYRATDGKDSAIVWLHGGSDRFSPRWHSYAQFFATAGFEFLALNYTEHWPRGHDDHGEQAADAARLVRSLREEGYRQVYLLGVSTGTQVIQAYLERALDPVDAVVEYSPVDNDRWAKPMRLPPLLAFTGENDPLLNHPQREDEIAAHRALGDRIEWTVYPNEGHDLRGRAAIEARMNRTLEFLLEIGGGRVIQADVVEVPRLDQHASLPGRPDGAGVGPE